MTKDEVGQIVAMVLSVNQNEVSPSAEIRDLVDEESKINRLIAVFYIFGGIVSCVLILSRQNVGRYIAIGFSLIVLSMEAQHYSTGLSLKLLFYELKIAPSVVIRNEILRTVICVMTIIHLTRSSVISEFKQKVAGSNYQT
jgi:hypothetical protein